MESVKTLVKEIKEGLAQQSSSQKDEIRVMRAMLNDPTYKVDVYGKTGIEGQYCPYEESRTMVANIIKDTTKFINTKIHRLKNISHVLSGFSNISFSKNSFIDNI